MTFLVVVVTSIIVLIVEWANGKTKQNGTEHQFCKFT